MTNWVLPHIDVPMSGHCFNGKSNFWGKVLSTSEWFQIHWNEVAFLVLSLPFLLLWCCLYAHHLMSRKTTGFNNDIDRPWYALMHSCMNCLEYWYCISETEANKLNRRIKQYWICQQMKISLSGVSPALHRPK